MKQFAKFIDDEKIQIHEDATYPVTLHALGKEYKLRPKTSDDVKYVVLPVEVSFHSCVVYDIEWEGVEKFRVDIEEVLTSTETYHKYFEYIKFDLGVSCGPKRLTARFYAPLAQQVFLNYIINGKPVQKVELKRNNYGVFSGYIDKHLHSAHYTFEVTDFRGNTYSTIDPFTEHMTNDMEYSVAVDRSKINKANTKFKVAEKDAVIYRMDINKFANGDFDEFLKPNQEGKPRGINYVKNLGVTHVEFKNVTLDKMGYYQAINSKFVEGLTTLEGIRQFSKLVSDLSKNDIGTILAINFKNALENAPYKEFKANEIVHSDFNFESEIVQQYVVDALINLVKVYGVSGFRLKNTQDLPERLLKSISRKLKSVNKSIVIYISDEDAMKNRHLAQVNHKFKDVILGSKELGKGVLNENTHILDELSKMINLDSKEMTTSRLINYIEDNDSSLKSLFTKRKASATMVEKVNLANATLLLSKGIPVIEMGQEIGSDFETFNWDEIDANWGEVNFIRQLIGLRRLIYSGRGVKSEFAITAGKKLLMQTNTNLNPALGHDEITIVYNFTEKDFVCDFDAPQVELFNIEGIPAINPGINSATIHGLSVSIFAEMRTPEPKEEKVQPEFNDK